MSLRARLELLKVGVVEGWARVILSAATTWRDARCAAGRTVWKDTGVARTVALNPDVAKREKKTGKARSAEGSGRSGNMQWRTRNKP